MTKGELRKLRKQGNLRDFDSSDRGNEPMEFSPEHLPNGRPNLKRARALERYARFVYDYDRD